MAGVTTTGSRWTLNDESTAWVFGGVGHETDKSLWAAGIVALHP
jgi:hypothetical protein